MNYSVFFTNRCNLNCRYCYEQEMERCACISYATLANLIQFIKQKRRNDADQITITIHGGEPLLEYKKIVWFMGKCSEVFKTHVVYSMTSNFTFLNDEILDAILPSLFRVYVSIDGCATAHDTNRVDRQGNGTYSIVKDNILRALKIRPDLVARMTLSKNTMHYFEKSMNSLISLGIKEITFELNMNDDWTYQDLVYIQNVARKISRELIKDNIILPQLSRTTKRSKKGMCSGGISSFVINSNGDIFPCILSAGMTAYKIGNINENNHIKQLPRYYYTENKEKCIGCSHIDICDAGRCNIINEIKTGSVRSKWDYFCTKENLFALLSRLD